MSFILNFTKTNKAFQKRFFVFSEGFLGGGRIFDGFISKSIISAIFSDEYRAFLDDCLQKPKEIKVAKQ